MKITFNWLKEYLKTDLGAEEIAELLTRIGFEVESIIDTSGIYQGLVVAEVVNVRKHPNSNVLSLCRVNDGNQLLEIVCGASNVTVGMKTVLAKIGATVPSNGLQIQAAQIKGIASHGMLCSEEELGISTPKAEGIINLNFGEVGKDFFVKDTIFDLSITPNRGDCLSIRGIARDLAAAGAGSLLVIAPVKISNSDVVELESCLGCYNYNALYINGITNRESPITMRQRMLYLGLKPISLVVDLANYLTISYGCPIHIYDADKLQGSPRVISGEQGNMISLNGQELKLEINDLVVKDNINNLALAGIMGAKSSGCNFETKNILIEVASFDPIAISTTARRLNLNTEASLRFSRGVDHEMLPIVLDITASQLIKLIGGTPQTRITSKCKIEKPAAIKVSLLKANQLLGLEIPKINVKNILTNLGCKVEFLSEEEMLVTPPTWRFDLAIPEDIYEELIRIYGYENVVPKPLPPFYSDFEAFCYRPQPFKHLSGIQEVITWSFMSSKVAQRFGFKEEGLIKIVSPVRSNLDVMRPSMIPNLLEVAEKNESRGQGNLAIFEIGKIYRSPSCERNSIAILRCGRNERTIYKNDQEVDFFLLKSDLEKILHGIKYELRPTNQFPLYYEAGKVAVIMQGEKIVGYLGEINRKINYKVSAPIVGLELFDLDFSQATNDEFFFSEYQMVNRDFCFTFFGAIIAQKLVQVVQTSSELIQAVSIFDRYSGGPGETSLAFSVKIQAKDRTLTASEIDLISEEIIHQVSNKLSGVLRGKNDN